MVTQNSLNNKEIPDDLIAAKGDLIVGTVDDTPGILSVGSSGEYLRVGDSSELEWASPPGGVSDHGALTGLADDDHTQYILKSIINAKGDILIGSADNTPDILTVGASGTYLMASGAGDLVWTNEAPSHTDGSVAQVANVVFGTGAPPDEETVPEGTIWIKYIA